MIPPSSDVRKPKANTFNIVQQTRSWRAKPACEDSAARTAGAAGAARGADHVRAGARGLSAARSDEDWGAVGRRASARQDGVPKGIIGLYNYSTTPSDFRSGYRALDSNLVYPKAPLPPNMKTQSSSGRSAFVTAKSCGRPWNPNSCSAIELGDLLGAFINITSFCFFS